MLTELLKIVWLACDFYLFSTELLLLVTCESSLFIEDVSTLFFLFFFYSLITLLDHQQLVLVHIDCL